MNVRKTLALTSAVFVLAAGITACSQDSGDGSDGGDVTMTLWHNSTTGDGKKFWDDTIKAFEDANPGVKIKAQVVQNEDMDGSCRPRSTRATRRTSSCRAAAASSPTSSRPARSWT